MSSLYSAGIYLYFLLVRLAVFVNPRAKRFIKSRKSATPASFELTNNKKRWIWVHVASLGEFEQTRPIIERIKSELPQYLLLLTFYSPSGYDVRKNFEFSDYTTYLPIDLKQQASRFIHSFNISLACFVKSEYWLNHLKVLNDAEIPVINIAARFNHDQMFFKWYGDFYKGFLKRFDQILVQNTASQALLANHGIGSVVCGDTRFDRVIQHVRVAKPIKKIEDFVAGRQLIVFGSVWNEDLRIIYPALEQLIAQKLAVIIAPHEVTTKNIHSIEAHLPVKPIRFSKSTDVTSSLMIVDTIGHLATIYQYAHIVYIGGAFRGTLHNILEPLAFGIPVMFGRNKNNSKFPEAVDLVQSKICREIESPFELISEITLLTENVNERAGRGKHGLDYIRNHGGATEICMDVIKTYLTTTT